MEKVLILYSNPGDSDRLRLDKEHRMIDRVLQTANLPSDVVVRRHAATFEDLLKAVAEAQYTVIQFSGHGSPEGIYLESKTDDSGELILARRIARLLREAQPSLKLAIFMSCFSADAVGELVKGAPYLITVFGSADDELAIEFAESFYSIYFKHPSIERAFSYAQQLTGSVLETVLSRRALTDGGVLFQIFPNGQISHDPLLVDLSAAEADIKQLGVSREHFLSALSRKVEIHMRIFEHPRDHAILPVGRFIGVFSWKNVKDIILCHRILRMKPELNANVCEVWARLAVRYNDSAMEKYRWLPADLVSFSDRELEAALRSYRNDYGLISSQNRLSDTLNEVVPEQYKLSKSLMAANLEIAESKLNEKDYGLAVVYLESALSALHDLVDALTTEVSVNVDPVG